VADAEFHHALWRDVSGHMVALRLSDGCVLWRSAEAMWPLLLGAGLALGLSLSPPSVVALALAGSDVNEGAGRVRWRSLALPWPEWAARQTELSAADIRAAWLGESILLRGHLRPIYKGGAPPGPMRSKPAPAVGSCQFDAASGAMHEGVSWPAGAEAANPGSADASGEHDVLTECEYGGVQYRLVHRPAHRDESGMAVQIALVSHDVARGHLLWDLTLEETNRRAPRALRP
jgi:hypothetical protein